jgi:hypothetical protein
MSAHYLTTRLERTRGALGRDVPGDVFIFEYDSVDTRTVHSFGMRHPIKVEFISHGETTQRTILQPWRGIARGECSRIREVILE